MTMSSADSGATRGEYGAGNTEAAVAYRRELVRSGKRFVGERQAVRRSHACR